MEILMSPPLNSACKRLDAAFPNCCCEKSSVCELSPGKIEPAESLARFVSAQHVDKDTNSIMPNLFEYAGRNGMSTTRIEKAGLPKLKEQQLDGGYIGFVRANVCDIRSIRHIQTNEADQNLDKQVFAVYDTAQDKNIFHADVCQTVHNPGAIAVKLRRQLQEQFTSEIENLLIQ